MESAVQTCFCATFTGARIKKNEEEDLILLLVFLDAGPRNIRPVVFAGDFRQGAVLGAVVNRGFSNLLGINELLELVLLEGIALRFHFVLDEHQRDDPAKNGNPNNPGTWRHPELAPFFGVLLVVVIFILV